MSLMLVCVLSQHSSFFLPVLHRQPAWSGVKRPALLFLLFSAGLGHPVRSMKTGLGQWVPPIIIIMVIICSKWLPPPNCMWQPNL